MPAPRFSAMRRRFPDVALQETTDQKLPLSVMNAVVFVPPS
jgi:hypothetical protein